MVKRSGKGGRDGEDGPVQLCPKCGAPRLGHAWDCAKCGNVFDASGPAQLHEAEKPASTAPASRADSTRRPATAGSAALRSAAPRSSAAAGSDTTRHTGLRGWVDENLPVAIIIAIVAYLVVYAILSTQLVTSTNDATAITTQYRTIVGESPPTAFQPVLGMSLVGRRLQVFVNSQNGHVLLLYHEGWLAGQANAARLAALPDKALDFLEVPFKNIGERQARMLHLSVDLRVIDVELGPGATMRGYVATFTGNTERPAVLCLLGQSESVIKMARTMFREQ
jgi:hypothetical protein